MISQMGGGFGGHRVVSKWETHLEFIKRETVNKEFPIDAWPSTGTTLIIITTQVHQSKNLETYWRLSERHGGGRVGIWVDGLGSTGHLIAGNFIGTEQGVEKRTGTDFSSMEKWVPVFLKLKRTDSNFNAVQSLSVSLTI